MNGNDKHIVTLLATDAPFGAGHPRLFPLVHLLRHLLFLFFYFSLSFIGFTYFLF